MPKNKNIILVVFISFLLLITTTPPLFAEEDFDYSVSYDLDKYTVDQGENIAVTITLNGTYKAQDPFILDKQIEANVELLLDGHQVGSATIPFGPVDVMPYQMLTLTETIPGVIPSTTAPGEHQLTVRSYFDALGYKVDDTKTFTLSVLERPMGTTEIKRPELYLSLSPSQMYQGSTTTLTLRVLNPNDVEVGASVTLFSETYGYANSLGSCYFLLPPRGSEEIRRSFSLNDSNIQDLCFMASLDWYDANEERCMLDYGVKRCAEILNRPVIRPLVTFENFRISGPDTYQVDLTVNLTNEAGWDSSLVIEELSMELDEPDNTVIIGNSGGTFSDLRRDIEVKFIIEVPLREECVGTGSVSGTYAYCNPIEVIQFSTPFRMPPLGDVRDILGLAPLGGRVEEPCPAFDLTNYLASGMGHGITGRESMGMIFTFVDAIFG